MGAKSREAATKANTKIIPAPLGFPADFLPSWANSLPASFGNQSLSLSVAIMVVKKANKIPINAPMEAKLSGNICKIIILNLPFLFSIGFW